MVLFIYTSRFISIPRFLVIKKVGYISSTHPFRQLTTNNNNSSDNNKDTANTENKEKEPDISVDDNTTTGESSESNGEINKYMIEIESLKKSLTEKDQRVKELQDAYKRSLADQENLRQRSTTEINTTKEYAIQKFAKEILDTVDILGLALSSIPVELRNEKTAKEWEKANEPDALIHQLTTLYTGVSMMDSELIKTLNRHGIEQFDPMNEKFDPNQHQALFQTSIKDKEPGTIFSVQKLGYKMKNRILRPAQVGVVSDK
ncbi:unnamed protein product [Cunninghamella blakesleeana]